MQNLIEAAPRSVGEWFDVMPFTRRHVLAGLVLFVAFVIEAWEMMIIVFASEMITADLRLSVVQTSALMSALYLGMIPGTLMWGRLVDRWGRKKAAVRSLALYSIMPLLCALAPSFEVLWTLRFVAGVILSGTLAVVFPFFIELMPVGLRGRASVYLSAGFPLGILVAIAVTVLLMDFGWRPIIGFSSIVGLWAWLMHRVLPESPYWLAERGQLVAAEAVIRDLSESRERHPVRVSDESTRTPGAEMPSLLSLFRRSLLLLTSMQALVNFCFALAYWGVASWMPALLRSKGMSAPEGLSFIALSALFMFPGYVAASYLTGRFGRKAVMVGFVFLAACAGFGFATANTVVQLYAWNFALSFFNLGAWGVWNTWLGELYRTEIRGTGYALGAAFQRIGTAVAPIIIGTVIAGGNFAATVLCISSFLALTCLAASRLPESEGKTLQ